MAATSSTVMALNAGVALASSRNGVNGSTFAVPQKVQVIRAANIVCRAEKVEYDSAVSRRAALTFFAGAAALTLKAAPAEAAYGESANIFAPAKKDTGFTPLEGDGFKVQVPSRWNPRKLKEFPGTILSYEDNFDQICNLVVIKQEAAKSSITDYGSPEAFLAEYNYLLGKQSYAGLTASEGGFDKNAVSTASVLASGETEIDGKTYYKLSVLTRTADGNEGGIHQLITATINDGTLYIFKAQAGDKRWFKGLKKFVEGAENSFVVV
eukprot:TRINITY_DN1401_c0_g1_i3.p1 TRINITY_DN1401_c0_g1~~TRINITY_DN1401_c0_g1_i3.p1  ORF type:complete len:267 (-),score=68.80 TRINITY_DN1401_c0_g1_i3:550-1350(-)